MSCRCSNPSVPISLLTVILILFSASVSQAQVCQDNLWPDGEFCGHDALVVTGEVDMNHDCTVDFIDNVLFMSQVGMTGPGLSADLDGSGVVDIIDAASFMTSFTSGNLVTPCNPSPPTPDYCNASLSLSLDPNFIVSRGKLASPNVVKIYVTASGWVNAGAIEYALVGSYNVFPVNETSPAGWSAALGNGSNPEYFCWDGTGFPATGTTVVAEHEVFIVDILPATVELVDFSASTGHLTRWAPSTLDERNDFQVRRNVGINTIDPVSTTACPSSNTSPTLAITDPSGDIGVPSSTASYLVTGSASDTDGTINLVEYRVNAGSWQLATGTSSWTASVGLGTGENWVQVRTADNGGAYSSTQVVTITVAPGPFCHDSLWPDGEFCGHDALVVTGEPEMNHDCVLDFLDVILFVSQQGMTGPNLSSDLNDDGIVSLLDYQLFFPPFDLGTPVSPCNPSPPIPDYCEANLSLSLDPNVIVSRGKVVGHGPFTVYVVASGWSNAGAIEYALVTSANVFLTTETSPVGWTKSYSVNDGVNYYCWDGTGFPVTGTTVVIEHEIAVADALPATIQLVDYGGSTPLLTRWAPPTLDSRHEFQVRRNLGINSIDPVSTTACPSSNTSPTLAITEPSGDIEVMYPTTDYMIEGSATDTDGTINFVEYRVNDGSWQLATGTNSWNTLVSLVVGENWVQVRTADNGGAYSSTQVVAIERQDRPDLTITAWSCTDTLLAGCLLTNVSVSVKNLSGGDAPVSRVGFYLSNDAVIDASDFLVGTTSVTALPPGNTNGINTTITIPDDGPRGAVYLGAFVDDLDLVDETNEANNTASSPLEYPIPALDSIVDVANDQGRVVRLNVPASSRDAAGSSTPILQYEAFRRIDPLPVGTAPGFERAVEGTQISDPLKLADWEFVGAVPAHGHSEYNMIVSTLADSTEQGTRWSVFFVRAATVQPLVFFDSCPDSGYSIDNLPPGVPTGLLVAYAAGGNQLSWEPCPDDDFRYFRIYRGSSPEFVPDEGNLMEATTDMEWFDSSSDPWDHYYKISAVDRNGNESEAANSAKVTGVQGGDVPTKTALLNAVPNPFNPSTKLPFEMAAAGHARLKVYDTAGRLVATLVDENRDAGSHHVIWYGRDSAGRMSSAGVYLYRFEVGDYSETKRMVLVK